VTVPVLWHLKASHYNEKVRWALDYKRVPHERRALHAGFHERKAKRLSGGSTTPILEVDGDAIGDSTRIIERLERDHPEPPLYPADPEERRRALELEDFFDEELGPYTRKLLMHHLMDDPELFGATFTPDLDRLRTFVARRAWGRISKSIRAQFEIDDEGVAHAFAKLRAAGERFRAEVGAGGHLVGEGFTVADLTLAALMSPIVAPEQFPYDQPQRGHPRMAPVRDAVEESGLGDWTRETYARHRGTSAEV
jgi:glutathione S-transferase